MKILEAYLCIVRVHNHQQKRTISGANSVKVHTSANAIQANKTTHLAHSVLMAAHCALIQMKHAIQREHMR